MPVEECQGQRSKNVMVMPDGPTPWSSARAQTLSRTQVD